MAVLLAFFISLFLDYILTAFFKLFQNIKFDLFL